jgi:hypothetical protein
LNVGSWLLVTGLPYMILTLFLVALSFVYAVKSIRSLSCPGPSRRDYYLNVLIFFGGFLRRGGACRFIYFFQPSTSIYPSLVEDTSANLILSFGL